MKDSKGRRQEGAVNAEAVKGRMVCLDRDATEKGKWDRFFRVPRNRAFGLHPVENGEPLSRDVRGLRSYISIG